MNYVFQFDTVWRNFDVLLQGVYATIQLSLLSLLGGLVLGTVGALALGSKQRAVRWAAFAYGDVIRNTPLLIQMFLLFFGLASAGLRLSPLTAALIALTIHVSAYLMDLIRAGIDNVPEGQAEAGRSLGLTRLQLFFRVQLPQAIETIYPALVGQMVLFMLQTSLASTISAFELTLSANEIISRTFRSFEVYIVIAGIYLLMVASLRLILALVGVAAFPSHRLGFLALMGIRRRGSGRPVSATLISNGAN